MSSHLWDFLKSQVVGTSLLPVLRSVTGNGNGVDLQLGSGQAYAIAVPGVISDGTHTITFEESKNNNVLDEGGIADPYATLAAGSPTIVLNAALSNGAPQVVNLKNSERYVRAVATVTGSPSTGGLYGVIIGQPRKLY
jgi:hypothetical protein